MLEFSDAPYRFFPAKPNSLVRWLTQRANRKLVLRGGNHRIKEIQISGATKKVRELREHGSQILFIPNHPTHSDPQVMTEVQRQLGVSACFMAAYDVFMRSKRAALAMQWNGAFSIDREGSDRKAMSAAIEILKTNRYALTIFPEGNVYLTNDAVTPFLEGGSFIALKAQRDMMGGRDEQPIHVVPVSLKYTHLTDVREGVSDRLAKVAATANTTLDRSADPVAELVRIGQILLERSLAQRGLALDITPDDHAEYMDSAAEAILKGLEQKMALPDPKPRDTLKDRVRKIRSQIHAIRIDSAREADHRVAAGWADEAILAFRILNYSSPYVSEKPTLDRYAETVERLYEDVFSRWEKPLGPRRAHVKIGDPIDLREMMESFSRKARNATIELTRATESAVQSGIDQFNEKNDSPGGKLF